MRLRTPDAARHLGVSPKTLEKWRLTGSGPRYAKLGTAVVYDTRELDSFVAARERASTSDPGPAIPDRPPEMRRARPRPGYRARANGNDR